MFFLFFTLSGFCSLVYQIAWLRIAMANFGVTSTMVSIVLSVFMAGLSVGSWGGGRYVSRLRMVEAKSQLRTYGTLEAVIGLSGLVAVPILNFGRDLITGYATINAGSGTYYLASGTVVFAGLFPFCACMGATFPVAMTAVKQAFPGQFSTSFSYLYLANLLGAVTGCICTAFLMIELLGFQGSLFVAVVLNFTIAGFAYVVSGRIVQQTCPGSAAVEHGSESTVSPGDVRLYAVLLGTGFVSMALEVIWIRQFTLFLGPVVYTFASILALFLIANYAGSALYRRNCRHPLLQSELPMALLLAIAGVTALLTLFTADYRLPFSNGISGGLCRITLGVVPFGFTVGFITPWVVDRLSGGDPRKAGTAYSLNTVGCILGPLCGGFILLPLIGERWSLVLLATLLFLLIPLQMKGSWPEWMQAGPASGTQRATIVVITVTSLLLIFFSKGYEDRYPGSIVLRDHTATVIAAGDAWERQLLVNGYGMTELTPVTKFMVHLPMAMHFTPPEKGLVLCFGMGTSFRSMLSWGVQTTVVELVPSIPKLFGYYHQDADRLVASPNARIVIDDARRYLSRTKERYDVIVVDPPPPIEAAASSLLYSVEFYRDVVQRLSPGGIFQQWTDMNDPYLLSAITRSLVEVFPFVRAFVSVEGTGMHYIASMTPLPVRGVTEMAAAMSPRAAEDLVEWGPFSSSAEQFSAIRSREQDIAALIHAAPKAKAIVDDRPINEYFLIRQRFGRH
jgi:spermidine synthase